MNKSMESVSDQVEWCLENRPETKSDDLMLALSVWKNFHLNSFKDMLALCLKGVGADLPFELMGNNQGLMTDLPASESISRCRRKFNEKGKYLPDPSTVTGRRKKELETNDWAMSDRDHL